MATKEKPTQHVAVRLDEGVVARIDALLPRLSTEWRAGKRSDALRALILLGLQRVDADPDALRVTVKPDPDR